MMQTVFAYLIILLAFAYLAQMWWPVLRGKKHAQRTAESCTQRAASSACNACNGCG